MSADLGMSSVVPLSRIPKIVGVVQAGGQGSRMDVLTRERAKPALPFAGSYQLVDFALSNFGNSGIPDVWVSVQYEASSLDRHLAGGRPWDLDRTRGGYRRLVPEEGQASGSEGFSAGNADDLLKIGAQLREAGAEVVVVTSADQVYRLDMRAVVAQHLERGSEATIVTVEVPLAQAKHKTVVDVGRDGVVQGLTDKPTAPPHGTIAAEIFVYDVQVLLRTLDAIRHERAQADPGLTEGIGDFPDRLLPRLVEGGKTHAYALTGYWRDLGRPSAYLAAHRELLRARVDVFDDPAWPILTRSPEMPPPMMHAGSVVEDSMISPGSHVHGTVRRSVVGPGCVVEAGAVVEDSVLMHRVRVASGAQVFASVVDDSCRVGEDAQVGAQPKRWPPSDSAVVLVGRESHVAKGVVLEPGARLEPGTTAS